MRVMQCMEVWGGNEIVDKSIALPGLDAWIYAKPYHDAQAGGDVYYVSSCATGRIVRLLIADVSGHGDAVRETAMHLRDLMRRFVNHIEQDSFVRSMNQQFVALSHGGSFATAVVTTFFAPTNSLVLCNAGHPPPLIFRAREKRWELLEQIGNIPLGIDDVADYPQFGVDVAVGDLVLCYTDSLIESRDARGEMLGVAGLLALVREVDVSRPEQVIANLLARVAAVSRENLTQDDVTILLFRPNGLAPHAKWRDRLLAPFRILATLPKRGVPVPWPEISLANIGGALLGPFNRFARARSRGTGRS